MKKILFGFWLAAFPFAVTLGQYSAPGSYWQQEVSYSIDVTLDDEQHLLTGQEEVQYTNNSPDQLTFIWFHLWPNAYRDNTTAYAKQQLRNGSRWYLFAEPGQRGYVDQLDFRVNGEPATLKFDPNNPDVAKLVLPTPLMPGAKARITTPFRVKIPASFSRSGHTGQAYRLTQWYPKPAVYDQRGWHPIPYLDQGEFYSEFGSFDVRITLPANYTVGATGVLQNPNEQRRLDRIAAVTAHKKTQKEFGDDLSFPVSSTEQKTLRYVQDHVHDFAWFADKRYHVLRDSVVLPSGRQVTTWVMFTNKEAEKWVKGLQDVNDAIHYYSQWVGEYPYASATALDGSQPPGVGGMEYPMIAVAIPSTVVHEVGHNWFYGILGSNERDYAWLDEGCNSYLEDRVNAAQKGGQDLLPSRIGNFGNVAARLGLDGLPLFALKNVQYQAAASRGLDQPVTGVTSAGYSSFNYGGIVYAKTAALLHYLAGYLGQEAFDRAMHAYFEQWKFRHPYPEDMQTAFEASTGQRLGWFFKDMLGGTIRYNADIADLQVTDRQIKVLVRNDSPAPFAVPVATLDAQGKVLETQWTFMMSRIEEDEAIWLTFRNEGVAAVVVDPTYLTPQLYRRDDRRKISGSLRSWESVRFTPLASVERWDRTTVNWLPVLGANTSDKLMVGAAFYSNPIIIKRLSYLAMPMYSFNRNELNGIGVLNINILPTGLARQVVTSVTMQRFERYYKVEPSITFALPHSGFGQPRHILKLASTAVRDQDAATTSSIQTVDYRVEGGDVRQSWNANVEFNHLTPVLRENNPSTEASLLRASVNYTRYYSARKRVQVRLFGGGFLQQPNRAPFVVGLSGSPDYRRQTFFFDRQQIGDALTAQVHQTDDRDGAFKAYLPVGSTRWLCALNLQADLPVAKLAVFADLGASKERFTLYERRGGQRTYYDAGLVVPLLKNVVQFYLPAAGTQYENGLPSTLRDFTDRIRFVIRFNQLNPFQFIAQRISQ